MYKKKIQLKIEFVLILFFSQNFIKEITRQVADAKSKTSQYRIVRSRVFLTLRG